MKSNGADRLQQSPTHLLHRAGQCADDIFQAEMKINGLTPRQLAVLMAVAENEGLKPDRDRQPHRHRPLNDGRA